MIDFMRRVRPARLVALAILTLAFSVPAVEAPARNPGKVSAKHCQKAAKSKVHRKYGNVRVQFLGHPNLRQVSNTETGVRGKGQADTSRGWVRFHYDCIYNVRSGHTHGTSVRYSGGSGGKHHHSHRDRDHGSDAGEVVGAVIGAVIAGAILNSLGVDQSENQSGSKDGGWWSPASGVSCNSYQSTCYRNGRFDPQWTHRIYK